MAMECTHGETAVNMMETTDRTKSMDMEATPIQMVASTLESGQMDNSTAQV